MHIFSLTVNSNSYYLYRYLLTKLFHLNIHIAFSYSSKYCAEFLVWDIRFEIPWVRKIVCWCVRVLPSIHRKSNFVLRENISYTNIQTPSQGISKLILTVENLKWKTWTNYFPLLVLGESKKIRFAFFRFLRVHNMYRIIFHVESFIASEIFTIFFYQLI